jgi:DNA modification methylase
MSNLNHNPIIKNIPLKDIKPYSNNPRKKQNITKVVNSIKEFGFQQPIVVDKKNIIIVGHSRYEAGKELGLDKVPVIIADLSPVKAKAYRIADNRINQDSEWDFSKLKLEFKDISKLDFNLDSLGFEKNELDDLIINEVKGFTDDDAVPDKPKKPKSKSGEIYQLGHHRLMCGDATKEEDVKKLMNNKKADMVFTDPPYNIGFKGTLSCTSKDGKIITIKDGYSVPNSQYEDIKNDKKTKEEFKVFIKNTINRIKENVIGGWYICFASTTIEELLTPLVENDMRWKSLIVWNKNQSPMGGGHFRKKYEPIAYGYFDNNFYGRVYSEDDVWDIDRTRKNDLHPTMKPISLIEKAIGYSSKQGGKVLDIFGGSGSTLIACEKTNRNCYMMEIDPIYVDVIIKRWEDYTGKSSKKI